MPSKIEATWVGLHASDKQTAIQSKEVCTQTMAHNNKEVMPQSKPSIYHYSITVDGEQLEVDIPDMVKSVFDEEFGSLDEEVKQTIIQSCLLTICRIFGCCHFYGGFKRRWWQSR